MKKENIFANLVKNKDKEIFQEILSKNNIKIERIISHGQSSPKEGWYDQEGDEWVMVLKGKAVLSFKESDDVVLESGEYINIPAHTKHKVSWTAPDEETIWLAVHY
jgi:cupin 2 domain-containing protein